jgi:hypothetical protein
VVDPRASIPERAFPAASRRALGAPPYPRDQEVTSHAHTPPDPQTNRLRLGRLLDRWPGGRSLPRSWFEMASPALPRQRHERPVGGPSSSHRLGVPRRLAVALLALGCVLLLLAPHQSWASSLVARRETHAGSAQSHHARDAQVLPHTAVAAPSRPDVRSTADDASVLVLLVLTLNSAVMLIRVASSPPSWMKD